MDFPNGLSTLDPYKERWVFHIPGWYYGDKLQFKRYCEMFKQATDLGFWYRSSIDILSMFDYVPSIDFLLSFDRFFIDYLYVFDWISIDMRWHFHSSSMVHLNFVYVRLAVLACTLVPDNFLISAFRARWGWGPWVGRWLQAQQIAPKTNIDDSSYLHPTPNYNALKNWSIFHQRCPDPLTD